MLNAGGSYLNRRAVLFVLVLLTFAPVTLTGCGTSSTKPTTNVQEVGFDLDDTLVFSTPAFERGFDRTGKAFSKTFWSVVNTSDAKHSCIKPEAAELVRKHRKQGRELFVITARQPVRADAVRRFVELEFGIPRDHVFFEPEDKTERLKTLGIDIYYGDSDSDISDAQEANIKPIRVQRNPKSNYDEKYNPGKFGEEILEDTADHNC